MSLVKLFKFTIRILMTIFLKVFKPFKVSRIIWGYRNNLIVDINDDEKDLIHEINSSDEDSENEIEWVEEKSESEPEIECNFWDEDCKIVTYSTASNLCGCTSDPPVSYHVIILMWMLQIIPKKLWQ